MWGLDAPFVKSPVIHARHRSGGMQCTVAPTLFDLYTKECSKRFHHCRIESLGALSSRFYYFLRALTVAPLSSTRDGWRGANVILTSVHVSVTFLSTLVTLMGSTSISITSPAASAVLPPAGAKYAPPKQMMLLPLRVYTMRLPAGRVFLAMWISSFGFGGGFFIESFSAMN